VLDNLTVDDEDEAGRHGPSLGEDVVGEGRKAAANLLDHLWPGAGREDQRVVFEATILTAL
jgi:hypothetical protein